MGLALALAGCDKGDGLGLLGRSRASTESRRGSGGRNEEDDHPEGPRVWLSGVEFPAAYDWQRDTAYGSVDARLVLFRDGERRLAIPAGEKHHVSTDPDMHRIVGGHLYTDYSSGEATYIGRDGKELFRFDGREMMAGFLVRETEIWTLGLDRDTGRGITLRKNGEPVFTDPQGRLQAGDGREGGLLQEDDGHLYFYYYQETRKNGGTVVRNWYQVCDGRAENLLLPQGVSAILDACRTGGKTILATLTLNGGRNLTVLRGNESLAYSTGVGDSVRGIRILPAGGGKFYIKGEILSGSQVRPVLWDPEGVPNFLQTGTTILDAFAESGHFAYLWTNPQGSPVHCVVDGFGQSLEGRNHYISSHCARLSGGSFYLALTPFDRSAKPFLLKDGVRQEIPLYGYLTYVSITR